MKRTFFSKNTGLHEQISMRAPSDHIKTNVVRMKTTIFALLFVATMPITSSSLYAQHPMGHHGSSFGKDMHAGIPNLTEDQKTKIKDLRLLHFKEIQPLRNQLGELKAKQNTLATLDKPDIKAINANIDEITKLMNQLMKSRAANRQQIRGLLTDEQKMWFDSHPGKGRHAHIHGKMNQGAPEGKMQEKV